jgi:hypothetical protein
VVERRCGPEEAERLVEENPLRILDNMVVLQTTRRPAPRKRSRKRGIWGWAQRIVGR